MIYACIGWCCEVAFAAAVTGNFVNRGFLNGPICPIYGFGVCIAVMCLKPISENLILLFICSSALTSALEFLTGFVLEKIYHERWWDYSDKPLNIKGYICIEFSLLWGAVCAAVIKLVHPVTEYLVALIPTVLGWVLLGIFIGLLLADFIFTVVDLQRFRAAMRIAEKLSSELHNLSDDVGIRIYEGVKTVHEHSEDIKEKLENIKEDFAERAEHFANEAKHHRTESEIGREAAITELKDAISQKLKVGSFTGGRLAQAFPNLNLKEKIRRFRDESKK